MPSGVEELRKRLDFLEKEIVHLKGEEKKAVVKEYYKLLHLCNKDCQVDESIYINHS